MYSQHFFLFFLLLEICTSFRTTCKKHPLENYILAYHTADKDHAEILQTVYSSFVCVFFVSYINRNHKDITHPQGRTLDTTLCIDQNVSQTCQPDFLKIWRVWIFLFIKTRRFQLKQGHCKIAKLEKIGIQTISRLFESVSPSRDAFGCASDLLGT